MKCKRKRLILILVLFFILSINSQINGKVLDGTEFKTLTVNEIKNTNFTLALIHPSESIRYNDLNNNLNLEEEFKKNHDIIFLEYFHAPMLDEDNETDLSIYELKKSIKLIVDGKSYKCIDFYDYKFELFGMSSIGSEGAISYGKIFGYLLFPKVIDENKTESIKLVGDYKGNKINIKWNLHKINQMVQVFKN